MKNKYGHWLIKKEVDKDTVLCQCDCDLKTQKSILKDDLIEGRTLSCGHQMFRRTNTIDRRGVRFGRLVAKEAADQINNPRRLAWLCECDCGNYVVVQTRNLTSGNTKSCGCNRIYNFDITGEKFGMLEVLGVAPKPETTTVENVSYWHCRCECGNETVVRRNSLTTGNSKSCGSCLRESHGERRIDKILEENKINYEREYMPEGFILSTGGRPRFDLAVLNNEGQLIRLIEFDGEQHFIKRNHFGKENAYEITRKRDKEKNEWALKNNIPLVRIPYTLEDEITFEMIFEDERALIKKGAKESYEARCREHHEIDKDKR